jgi:hypothetical protein
MFDTVNVCSRDLLVSRVTHLFPVSFKRDQPVISKGTSWDGKGPVPEFSRKARPNFRYSIST